MRRIVAVSKALLLVPLLLAACGQTGDLYLPDREPPSTQPETKRPAPKPAPEGQPRPADEPPPKAPAGS